MLSLPFSILLRVLSSLRLLCLLRPLGRSCIRCSLPASSSSFLLGVLCNLCTELSFYSMNFAAFLVTDFARSYPCDRMGSRTLSSFSHIRVLSIIFESNTLDLPFCQPVEPCAMGYVHLHLGWLPLAVCHAFLHRLHVHLHAPLGVLSFSWGLLP